MKKEEDEFLSNTTRYKLIKKVKFIEIRLEKATENDALAIFDIQVKAFIPLLNKYEDY